MNNHFAMALKVGNRIPVHIFQLNNMNFKKIVSNWLISTAFYNINEFFTLTNISDYFNVWLVLP